MIRFISGVINVEIGTTALSSRWCIPARPHTNPLHLFSSPTKRQYRAYKVLRHVLPNTLAAIVSLPFDSGLLGRVRPAEDSYLKEAAQRRIDKSNAPYTKCPHRGRHHFLPASPGRSGGRKS